MNSPDPRPDTGDAQAINSVLKAVSAAVTLTPAERNIEVTTPASSNFNITLPNPMECIGKFFTAWSKNAGGGTATVTQPASSALTTSYALKGAKDYVILKSNGHAWLEVGKVITA